MNHDPHSNQQPTPDQPEASPTPTPQPLDAAQSSAPAAPEPAPEAEAASPRVPREAQKKAIQVFITSSYTLLHTASSDAELAAVLAGSGYDAAEFKVGGDLIKAAADAFDVRFLEMGGKTKAHEDLAAAEEAARVEYLKFRGILKAMFPEQAPQLALGLVGRLRQDFASFVSRAQASYENAAQDPYQKRVAKRGYPAARLKALRDELDALVAAYSRTAQAEGSAMQSTANRDRAYQDLRDYMREFKAVARAVFRGQPAALKKLKL